MKTNMKSKYTRLDPDHIALLVIDVQNDFVEPDGSYPLPGSEQALVEICRVMELFRKKEKPVVRIVRLSEPDGSDVDFCRREAAERGKLKLTIRDTWGAQPPASTLSKDGAEAEDVCASGKPVLDSRWLLSGGIQRLGPHEFAVYKPRFGAFTRTELHPFLAGLEVNSVVLVGFTFPNCVRATQLGAVDLDYRTGLIPEACTQVDPEGLEIMRNQGVQVLSIEELETLMD